LQIRRLDNLDQGAGHHHKDTKSPKKTDKSEAALFYDLCLCVLVVKSQFEL